MARSGTVRSASPGFRLVLDRADLEVDALRLLGLGQHAGPFTGHRRVEEREQRAVPVDRDRGVQGEDGAAREGRDPPRGRVGPVREEPMRDHSRRDDDGLVGRSRGG